MATSHYPFLLFWMALMCMIGVSCSPESADWNRTAEQIVALQAADLDQDGYCAHEFACSQEGKHPGDCKDEDATVNPGGAEGIVQDGQLLGDDIDNNCNGVVDEGAANVDNDGDGYCESTSCLGQAKPGDCNDEDPSVSPIGDETREGVDDNCDGVVDDGRVWHDDDGDGYCEGILCKPESVKPGDCDDSNSLTHPEAPEGEVIDSILLPDGIDNNCDGRKDEGTQARGLDRDGDLWCDLDPCLGSEQPGDCDDQNPLVYPGAPEGQPIEEKTGTVYLSDQIDNDCDGLVDEGTLSSDLDRDSHTPEDGDCDDQNPLAYPMASEWVDGQDNNCDGTIDGPDELAELPPALTGKGTFYAYFTPSDFHGRLNWSFDHRVNLASITWSSQELSLYRGETQTGEDYGPGQWQIERIVGPNLIVTLVDQAGARIPGRHAIQMDARHRPIRLSIVMQDPPRPGVFLKTGWPIDGMTEGPGLSEHTFLHAPQGVSNITLASDPTQTTLFFWKCQEAACTKDRDYLGQLELAPHIPHGLDAGPELVEIKSIDVYNLMRCREVYKKMQEGLAAQGAPARVEELFRPTELACTTPTGTAPLRFTLVFTR